VPKAVDVMRAHGISEADIETVVWSNPVAFFAQSGKLTLDAAATRPDSFEGNSVRRG
jgi:hypothetical protein